MTHRVAARLELGQVRVEHLVVGQVEPVPPVVAPRPLRQFHLPQVVGYHEPLDRRMLPVELVAGRDLRSVAVTLLAGDHAW